MKKIIITLLIAIMMLSFTSCKKADEISATNDSLKETLASSESDKADTENTQQKTETEESPEKTEQKDEQDNDSQQTDEQTDEVQPTEKEDTNTESVDDDQVPVEEPEPDDSGLEKTEVKKPKKTYYYYTKEEMHGKTIDFDQAKHGDSSVACKEYVMYDDYETFTKNLNLNNYIIFKGIKKNDSTMAYVEDYYAEWIAETPIEVTEAFYGNVQVGDTILLEEEITPCKINDKISILYYKPEKPISKNKEYIFIMSKTRINSAFDDTKPLYSAHPIYAIQEITDKIKAASSYSEYVGKPVTKGVSYEIYTRFYYDVNKENLKIDVKKEIKALMNSYISKAETEDAKKPYQEVLKALEDSKATTDSIIEMLSDSDKQLLNDMIKQYGAK